MWFDEDHVTPLQDASQVRGCKRLWAAVLHQAMKDASADIMAARARNTNNPQVNDYPAGTWLMSDKNGVGSLRWICDMLDMNPYTVRNTVLANARALGTETIRERRL